jgi:serine/threonine protein kinase
MTTSSNLVQYKKVRTLRNGHHGSVYEAEVESGVNPKSKEQRVVIKEYFYNESTCLGAHPDVLREMLILQTMKSPRIIGLRDVRLLGREVDLCLEYCDTDLRSFARAVDQNERVRMLGSVARQLLAAIGELHRVGIFHRDIKPDNILINRDGSVKLCDFGHSKIIDSVNTPGACTARYRAPEIFARAEYGLPADIWSAGCTLMEFVLLQPVFPATSDRQILNQILSAIPTSAADLEALGLAEIKIEFCNTTSYYRLPRLPSELANFGKLVEKMLVLDPSQRATPPTCLADQFFANYQFQLDPDLTPEAVWLTRRPLKFSSQVRNLAVDQVFALNRSRHQRPLRTALVACNIIDEYLMLADREPTSEEYILLPGCCLMMANKYFDLNLISYEAANAELRQRLVSLENAILARLGFKIHWKTMLDLDPASEAQRPAPTPTRTKKIVDCMCEYRLLVNKSAAEILALIP